MNSWLLWMGKHGKYRWSVEWQVFSVQLNKGFRRLCSCPINLWLMVKNKVQNSKKRLLITQRNWSANAWLNCLVHFNSTLEISAKFSTVFFIWGRWTFLNLEFKTFLCRDPLCYCWCLNKRCSQKEFVVGLERYVSEPILFLGDKTFQRAW